MTTQGLAEMPLGKTTKLCAGALLAGLGVLSLASQASATEWTFGLGVGAAPDYQGSEDYEAVPLWNVRADDLYDPNTYAQVIGNRIRSNLLPHPNIRLGVSGEYVFKRKDVDNDAVDRLRNTDDGFLLGALIGYDYDVGGDRVISVEFDPRFDISDNIGGLFTARGAYAAPIAPDWSFKAGIETTYATSDYMDEFFTIDAADSAASGLNTFKADDGFRDIGLSADVTYEFTSSWSATGSLAYHLLVDDAADSPVTDDEGSEHQMFFGALINYQF